VNNVSYEDKFIEYILKNYDESKKDFDEIAKQLQMSDLNFRDKCTKTLAFPKVFTTNDMKLFSDFISGCFTVFNKVIERYISDEEYRKLFPYCGELEKLILLPKQFHVNIPMTRIDFFYNEKTKGIKLCEVNTDGTGAMNKNRILSDLLSYNTAVREVLGDGYDTFELFDTWVNEFLSLWNEYSGGKANPSVAIVDFLDRGTLNEFKRFKEAFERNGISCIVCDIRELEYDGERLSYQGQAVDVIYRRAVTSDIIENFDSVLPFIAAVKDDNVCIVGGFRTQVIHNKVSFIVLHKKETQAFMTDEENAFIRRHVPVTKELSFLSAEEEGVFENKDLWIIKPFDLYYARGVHAGVDYTAEEWRELVEQSIEDGDYLMQEYCTPFRTKNIDFSEDNPEAREFGNMTGAFCYNEKIYGILSQQSAGGIISHQNERVLASVTI